MKQHIREKERRVSRREKMKRGDPNASVHSQVANSRRWMDHIKHCTPRRKGVAQSYPGSPFCAVLPVPQLRACLLQEAVLPLVVPLQLH